MKKALMKKFDDRQMELMKNMSINTPEFLARLDELIRARVAVRTMLPEEPSTEDEKFEEYWKAYCGKNEDLVKAKDAARFFYEVGKAQL